MNDGIAVVPALVTALVCAVLSLAVPALLARLPEPVLAEDDTGPYVPYAEIAATPRLALLAAALGAVGGGVVGMSDGFEWDLLLHVPMVPVAVALGIVDARTHLLPKQLVLGATGLAVVLVGVVWLLDGSTDDAIRALIGLVLARTAFWLLWSVRASGLGFGDVRLAALLGLLLAHCGWVELVLGLWIGFVLFSVQGVGRAVLRRDSSLLKEALPLGPFLLAGAVLGLLLAPTVGGSLVPA